MNEEFILKKHNEILNYFLNYKKKNNNFTFSLRKTNRYERLEKGYWFQGSNYIFVGLYKRGCKDNKTQTIGFVVEDKRQFIDIVYKNIDGFNDNENNFYNEIIELFKSLKYFKGYDKRHKKQYWFIFKTTDLQNNLKIYLEEIRPKIDLLIEKYNLKDKYIYTEQEFQKMLSKIKQYQNLNEIGEFNKMNNKIKNIVLYGVPGVGKTYSHKKLINMIESGKFSDNDIFSTLKSHSETTSYDEAKEEDRVRFITFHQSFGYEDFIEGFRPNEEGNIELQEGVFKDFCEKAKESDKNFYFVIDEINRANISKVFGELITLIEEDKREDLSVTLPYSKEPFSIPKNLYIIGTMNSTDKSIALIDIALRRRFTFLKMNPNLELVENEDANKIMKNLNEKITKSLGEDYQIGHSYFMDIEDDKDLSFICKYKIKPLLEEYFYGDKDGFDRVYEVIKDVCEA